MAITNEMRDRLKGLIDRLGKETVLKAFLNAQKRIAKELKQIEEEKKSKQGEVNKENIE